ncbi:MAG: chromosome segregation protein SMC [Planctomycetota bacterium]|nr:chromosome segregation protein SMC [Planctomycetota bacterium]
MHLKRLEAFGFKSFADKLVFDFERGVTAFVGPNGCGKSNVVDAVKWVLGEQSAKSLRGDEMADVIFNGTSQRRPLNFAEVTLTFDNASGKLPLGAPEVSVTRRLYRSGESEYLINKALCRLRDVRELFWDTGVGTSSYSIIEQGRVVALLEANSKDRRILFEEAAGIHKYKERKKIALRKLERVEQNLARLNDLLGEVERNLRSVTRQAERARRAKDITDRLRQAKLAILLNETYTSNTALRELTASLNLATERVGALTADLEKAQAATAAEQGRMGELDTKVSQAQQQLADARARLQRLEAEIEAEGRSIENLQADADRARAASHAAEERAAATASERERVELAGSQARDTLKERSEKAAALAQGVSQQQEQRETLVRNLEMSRRAAVDTLGRRTQLQDTLARAEAELNGLEYRVRKAQATMSKAADQLRFAQVEMEEIRRRDALVQRRREVLETEQSGIRILQTRTEEDIDRLTRTTQDLQRELENRRSRLTALEGLRESGEGLSPGARAVLTSLRFEMDLAPEVHGLVADCLSVDPRLEQAIEAALGGHIETVVVQSARTAQALAARLAEQEMGRACFIPLDRAEAALFARPPASPALLKEPLEGCLGCAADLVSCSDEYRPVAQALLGNVLVFDTDRNALESFHADKGSSGWQRVSLSGAFFESNGCFSGGRYKPQRLGLIGRKNEIARLVVQMDELRQKIEALAERMGFLEKRAQGLARDDERLGADLSALAHSHTELKSMLAAIEREESRSAEEKALAAREIHQLEAERAAHATRVQEMRADLEACKRAENEALAAVRKLESALAAHEAALADSRQHLAELERDCATWRERATAHEREAQSLSAQFAEKRDEADREKGRGAALDERRALATQALADKERQRAELADLSELYAIQAQTLQDEKEAARLAFEQARGREREIANELENARQELSAVRDREVNLRVRLESKVEQARSEFHVDVLAELEARGGPPPLPAPPVPKTHRAEQPQTPPAEQPAPETQDQPAVAQGPAPATPDTPLAVAQALVRQLEERLARLGPVNMYALEEQQELEKRHSFLKVQFEDLDSARASLRDVIARVNRRCRSLFQETFEAVKLHFNETFRKLFGGGKADLLLEEGEDVLEAGIEIIARPPGKEPRSVSLLSGGEKTMTMIALLFAVFRSRPAPFCILDEVDAPLDESNVDRFNLMVRDFLDQSQFLVITHNKSTMSYADVLYGITMPEPGVSKRIAIRFEDVEKHLPMDEIARAAAAARTAALAQAEAAQSEVSEAPPPAAEQMEEVSIPGAQADETAEPVAATVAAEAEQAAGGGQ